MNYGLEDFIKGLDLKDIKNKVNKRINDKDNILYYDTKFSNSMSIHIIKQGLNLVVEIEDKSWKQKIIRKFCIKYFLVLDNDIIKMLLLEEL